MTKRIWRIRKRSKFAELARYGKRARVGVITITWLVEPSSGKNKPQLAYSTGKQVGPSVVRNRVRRQLQAIMSELAPSLAPGSYLVKAGPKSSEIHFDDIRGNVWVTLQRLGALPKEDETQSKSLTQ